MSRTKFWSNAWARLNIKARVVALEVFQKVNGSLKVVFDLKTLPKSVTFDTHLSALQLASFVSNAIVHKLVRWLKRRTSIR
jgi:hypothetical protein